ncbi:Rpn family recombination-promoting nuclease/putative transposase [Treponema sp.]|uniref:Rpn family recombination-promoting nuclease/putative transposase n=1 Tax=Treponema sp. TaxID=166 RepID=UPI00298D6317|nr:Rpn family recombination-promoting nuclease/putative transposase [Treponema sp.]
MYTHNNEQTLEQKWQNATIANNFIFYKIMRNNPDICKELLEILLEFKIDHIEMRQEEEVAIDYGKKGIRLDVYAVGATESFYLEIQTTDTGELPERARYYQSILDVDDLNSGKNYSELKTSYIIFICIPDIFKKGRAKYTFENLCLEDTEIKLNDRTQKLFFIAENYDKILNDEQKGVLQMVMENKSTTKFSDKVSGLVEDAKHNARWRHQFLEYEIQQRYQFNAGKKEGIEEGARQNAIENAKAFLKEGLSPEVIARCVKLPLEQILELQEKN